MRFRWWNSFILLGILLLAIGIVGAFQGQRMVFEPGRVSSGREWIVYLFAGALMVVNGMLPGAAGTEESDEDEEKSAPAAAETAPAAAGTASVRENE